MAYNGANLSALSPATTSGGWQQWYYSSTDAIAVTRAANYISDAKDRGLKVGHIVWVHDTATPTMFMCYVLTVNATTGAADLTDGTAVVMTNT